MSNDPTTPSMTDSKTPDWVKEKGEMIASTQWLDTFEKRSLSKLISQALADAEQSGYERGRKEGKEGKEGIEEVAKFMEKNHTLIAGEPADPMMPSLIEAIRQLLEVKKDIDTRQNAK